MLIYSHVLMLDSLSDWLWSEPFLSEGPVKINAVYIISFSSWTDNFNSLLALVKENVVDL